MSDKPKYRFDPTEPGMFVQDYDLVDYPNLLNLGRIQEPTSQTGKTLALAAMMRERFSDMKKRSCIIPHVPRTMDVLKYRELLLAFDTDPTDHNARYSHVPIESRGYGHQPMNVVTQELRQCYGFKAEDRVPLVLKPLP